MKTPFAFRTALAAMGKLSLILAFFMMTAPSVALADDAAYDDGDGHDQRGLIAKEIFPVGGDDATAPEDDFADMIGGYQKQIENKKAAIQQIKAQQEAYRKNIEAKRQEAATLQNEVSLVDNKLAKLQLDIQATQLEIDATELELKQLKSQIQDKTLKIIRQREMMAEFLRALHKTDDKTAIDLILTERTISDFFNDVQALQQSERELKTSLDTVKTLKADLEERASAETAKRAHLVEIQEKLTQEQSSLDETKVAKEVLAEQARVSETRFRYELAQLRREEENTSADINEIDRKLRKTLDAQRLRTLSGGPGGWGWPVDPGRGITTYFHDPEYPFRYVFEHPGLDIRAAHGTPIRAPKGGYVGRAKDAGLGYSYIMLVHDGDLSTVFGHVSRIVVQEGTYVEKGDIVGYSGGTPGTPGAGALTTGPHLHFELRSNGIPVDPLQYLKL